MYQKMLAQRAEAAAAATGGGAGSSAAPPAPAPDAGLVVEPPAVKPPADGVLVVFGSTNWHEMGKKVGTTMEGAPNLFGPHRLLAGLGSIKLSFISSSPMSAHIIALGEGGEAFSWGRNEFGQLGHGDNTTRATPTQIMALRGKNIVAASTGKVRFCPDSPPSRLWSCVGMVRTGEEAFSPSAITVSRRTLFF